MYILDTDHLGVLQRARGTEFEQIIQRIAVIGGENIYVTIVSFHEIVAGWTKYVKQSEGQENIVAGYARLERILTDFANAQVLPYSTAAAEVFEDIRRKRVRVATMEGVNEMEAIARLQKLWGLVFFHVTCFSAHCTPGSATAV